MAKKTKYGKVVLPDSYFDQTKAVAHISIRLPLALVDQLKQLALTPEHEGRYQVLIRDILTEYVEKRKSTKKRA